MKKVLFILLVFISFYTKAQRPGKDYILIKGAYEALECEIVNVIDNKIYYKIDYDTTLHKKSIFNVADVFIEDKIKKCKLFPDKCNEPNPRIYFKETEIKLNKTEHKLNDSITYNVPEKKIYLTFDKPVNRLDSMDIDLQFTKFCLLKFKKELLTGVGLEITGYVIGLGGLFSEDKNTMIGCGFTGGLCAFIGFIVVLDSYKWMKRGSNKPFLEPYGNGVCIKF